MRKTVGTQVARCAFYTTRLTKWPLKYSVMITCCSVFPIHHYYTTELVSTKVGKLNSKSTVDWIMDLKDIQQTLWKLRHSLYYRTASLKEITFLEHDISIGILSLTSAVWAMHFELSHRHVQFILRCIANNECNFQHGQVSRRISTGRVVGRGNQSVVLY